MSTTYSFSTYTCVKYTTADGTFTWTPPAGITSYDVLVVAGGGGGGTQGNGGGAGGAGGLLWLTGQSCTPGVGISGNSVGAGGAGASSGTLVPGTNGTNSVFASNTAHGGGGGGAGSSGSAANNGKAGGSGGGGSGATAGNTATGGAGTSGEGSAGGSCFAIGSPAQSRAGGGGGGKGAVGTTATTKTGGNGGAGYDASALLGTSVGASGWFAGGGGGGTNDRTSNGAVAGTGGTGGGAAGENVPAAGAGIIAGAGTAETGGGGGGCSGNQNGTQTAGFGGAGGSGVIIVRYLAAPGVPDNLLLSSYPTQIDADWDPPVSGGTVTGYKVRWKETTGGTYTAWVDVSTATSYSITGLTPVTSYTVQVYAYGPAGDGPSETGIISTTDEPPGDPTSVTGLGNITTADLTWTAPTDGGAVTHYQVRIDGGSPSTESSPYVFTSLTPETSYFLEVRAVGPGGVSSWVGVTVTTLPGGGGYRVRVTVGSHVWQATDNSDPELGPTLPLTIGYDIPESADFFPAQASPITASFGLVVDTVADVVDIALQDPALIELWIPAEAEEPWLYYPAVVAQLQATVGQGEHAMLQVFLTDPIYLLASMLVGFPDDWPEESVYERVSRICDEAGITLDYIANNASTGTLAERASNPTDALSALREALTDDADKNDSYPGTVIYGRVVYSYSPTDTTLYMRVWDRTVFSWPAYLGDDGTLHLRDRTDDPSYAEGLVAGLDGCAVTTDGVWERLPLDLPTYVIVHGTVFGDPDAPGAIPYIRGINYIDTFPDNSGTAAAIDNLGNALVPTEYDPAAWRTKVVRHLSHLDPEPVTWWFGQVGTIDYAYESMPWARGGLRHVFIEPVAPELTLDGRTWIAGTLSGARFVLPPGGKHYIEVTLRPDLFQTDPHRIVPGSPGDYGPQQWAGVDSGLTWADIDPLITWRDMKLAGNPT